MLIDLAIDSVALLPPPDGRLIEVVEDPHSDWGCRDCVLSGGGCSLYVFFHCGHTRNDGRFVHFLLVKEDKHENTDT